MTNPNPTPSTQAPEATPDAAPGLDLASRPRKRLPAETIMVAFALGVTVMTIAWMRHKGLSSGMAFAEPSVQYVPPNQNTSDRYRQILDQLTQAESPLDVALGEFTSSPFMLPRPRAAVTVDGGPPIDEASEREREFLLALQRQQARRQELLDLVKGLKVQSIMDGRVPLARIDGQTVRVGDTVANELEVESIKDRSITLAADGELFTITLNSTDIATRPDPRPKKRRR